MAAMLFSVLGQVSIEPLFSVVYNIGHTAGIQKSTHSYRKIPKGTASMSILQDSNPAFSLLFLVAH
jgi:hypothetical protein